MPCPVSLESDLLRILCLVSLSFLVGWNGYAAPVSPDGMTYKEPGKIERYVWHGGVSVADLDGQTIVRDGEAEWDSVDAAACMMACDAFLTCQAFVFIEPKYKLEAPRCRMLSSVGDLVSAPEVSLYLPRR